MTNVLKYIGTLTAGCVVGVVVAMSWTGQGDLDTTLNYVSRLEALIETHSGNSDDLLEQLKEQQRIYKNDVKVYYDAVKESNGQTQKANDEIAKANEAAAKLEVDMRTEVERLESKYGMTNIIPPLVTNPDVNHPGVEHDNGAVGNSVVTHSGDIIITWLGGEHFSFENVSTSNSAITVKYTKPDGTTAEIKVPGKSDGENTKVEVVAKPTGNFEYQKPSGGLVQGSLT